MNEYFRELRNLGQEIDGGIKKLTKTWGSPHLMIGGYGVDLDEARPHVESFFGTLKEVQDQLIADRESRAEYIKKSDEYLTGADTFYQNLKQQCQEIETLLSEYGYKPLPDSTAHSAIDESETESSSMSPEQMQNTSSSRSRLDGQESSIKFRIEEPKSIPTPVIKSLASVKSVPNGSRK